MYVLCVNRPRVTLQNALAHIAPLTLRTLLYGNDNLELEKNTIILSEKRKIYKKNSKGLTDGIFA